MPLLLDRPRFSFALLALVCASVIGYALYLQHVESQDPCPLCLVQRGFYLIVMAVSSAAAVHGRAFKVYGALVALSAMGGAGTAARQRLMRHCPLPSRSAAR